MAEQPAPLSAARLAEIRTAQLGIWYGGDWAVEQPQGDTGPVHLVHRSTQGDTVLAVLPDFAFDVAVFLADAHAALPELLAEVDRLNDALTTAAGGAGASHAAPATVTFDSGITVSLDGWSLDNIDRDPHTARQLSGWASPMDANRIGWPGEHITRAVLPGLPELTGVDVNVDITSTGGARKAVILSWLT